MLKYCIAEGGCLPTSLLPVHRQFIPLVKKSLERKIHPCLLSKPLLHCVRSCLIFLITQATIVVYHKHTTSILQTLQSSYHEPQPLSLILANTYPQVSLEVSLLLEEILFCGSSC